VCGSNKLTDRWSGMLYIVNVDTSEVAKKLGLKTPGRYASKIKE
jgi:DNA-directed RNA polymerase subunit E"